MNTFRFESDVFDGPGFVPDSQLDWSRVRDYDGEHREAELREEIAHYTAHPDRDDTVMPRGNGDGCPPNVYLHDYYRAHPANLETVRQVIRYYYPDGDGMPPASTWMIVNEPWFGAGDGLHEINITRCSGPEEVGIPAVHGVRMHGFETYALTRLITRFRYVPHTVDLAGLNFDPRTFYAVEYVEEQPLDYTDVLQNRPLGETDFSVEEGKGACEICLEDIEVGAEVSTLPCDHWFHEECIRPWLSSISGECPKCRTLL